MKRIVVCSLVLAMAAVTAEAASKAAPTAKPGEPSGGTLAKALLEPQADSGVRGSVELRQTRAGTEALVALTNALPGKSVEIVLLEDAKCPSEKKGPGKEIVLGRFSPRPERPVDRVSLDLPKDEGAPSGGWKSAVDRAVLVRLHSDSTGTAKGRLACGVLKSERSPKSP